MRRHCSKDTVPIEKKEANGKWRKKSKAELVADFEAWDRLTASQPQSAPPSRNVDLVIPAMHGSLIGQALPADEVSRPTDEDCTTEGHEKRKDYAAMTLKEKNGFGSARFAQVFDTAGSSSTSSVPMLGSSSTRPK